MQNTFDLYNSRTSEIDFYFSILRCLEDDHLSVSSDNPHCIITTDNTRFFKILKSNFLLMLYNLIESCIVNGILEVYDNMAATNCTYLNVIDEIKSVWRNHQIASIHSASTGLRAYDNKVNEIIENITSSYAISLDKDCLDKNMGGNLDARKIHELCRQHKIQHRAADREGILMAVKNKRNDLAHGDVSFGECARDMTLIDLEKYKQQTYTFLRKILEGMKCYCDNKEYLIHA